MNNYKPNEYEQEIDLIELFWTLIEGWKLIAVLAVVFAILVGAGMYAKEYAGYKKASVQVADEGATQAAIDRLDEAQKTKVELYAGQNEAYIEMQKSIAMNLDYSDVNTISIEFFVDGEDSMKNETMAELYDEYLFSAELAKQLSSVFGSTYSVNDIYELMINSKTIASEYLGSIRYRDDSSAVRFVLFTPGSVDANAVVDCIKKGVESKQSELNATYANELVIVNESIEAGQCDSIMYYQNAKRQSINTGWLELKKAVEAFTGDENSYYKSLSVGEEETDAVQPEVAEIAPPQVSKKFIAVGFVLGAFIGCAIIGLKFLFSVKLSSAEIMAERFGAVIFGTVGARSIKDRKKCDRSIEEQIRTTATGIALSCKQKGIGKVAFTGSDIEHLNKDYINQVVSQVKLSGVDVVTVGNIFYDAKALLDCAEIGKAVIFEGIGISIYDEIENEIIKANEYNIELLGSVIL